MGYSVLFGFRPYDGPDEPKPDTDSLLKRLWEDTERRRATADNAEARAVIDAEIHSLRARWDELVLKKRHGQLTDRTKVEEVERVVKEVARLHHMPVAFLEFEGRIDEKSMLTVSWSVEVIYAGPMGDFDARKWGGFLALASAEVATLGTVDAACTEDDETDGEDLAYMGRHRPAYSRDPGRPTRTWDVKTEVWAGPPAQEARRRSSHR